MEKSVDLMDWGLSDLHNCLLSMLEDINSLCLKNNINYCLAYGSVLGAIRHGGFIPWDDDVDLYMTPADYDLFKKIARKDVGFSEKYYLQEFDSIDDMVEMPKIRLNNSTYLEEAFKKYDMHQGIYIDIFILHNAPKSPFKRLRQHLMNQYLVLKSLSNRHYNKKWGFLMNLLRAFPYNFYRKTALKSVYKFDKDTSSCFFDTDLRKYKKSFYDKTVIFPTKMIKFEGLTLPVPGQYEVYLENVYGDYMTMPNYETIKKSQHCSFYSVSDDFRIFLEGINDFSDERKGQCQK